MTTTFSSEGEVNRGFKCQIRRNNEKHLFGGEGVTQKKQQKDREAISFSKDISEVFIDTWGFWMYANIIYFINL